MRPRIYEIIEIEDYKDNDKNLIHLPRHGINQWLEILYFQAFDGRKK